jgi:hypothetical protein
MRRITMWIVSTITVLVLLFSYRTSTMGPSTATGPGGGSSGGGDLSGGGLSGGGSSGGGSSGGGAGRSGAGSGTSSGGANVVNGPVVQTQWGPVQVQVRISGGRIVDVRALQVPHGNRRDQEINSYAVPQLQQETLDAQSANIDAVSGATVTSEGYVRSLQAALDAAHFKA